MPPITISSYRAVPVVLGSNNDLIVEENGFLSTSDSAIQANAAGRKVTINGDIRTTEIGAAFVTEFSGHEITIGQKSSIITDGSAFLLDGGANSETTKIINNGSIFSAAPTSAIDVRSAANLDFINNGSLISNLDLTNTTNSQCKIINTGSMNSFAYQDMGNSSTAPTPNYQISFGEYSDVFINAGSIRANIYMRGGNNLYDGRKGTLAGRVTFLSGNDTALGGAGNERFFTGAGNDFLEGGAGDDILDGGAGVDTASYSGSASATVSLMIQDSNLPGSRLDPCRADAAGVLRFKGGAAPGGGFR